MRGPHNSSPWHRRSQETDSKISASANPLVPHNRQLRNTAASRTARSLSPT